MFVDLPFDGKIKMTKLYGTPPPVGMTYSAGKHAGIDLVGLDNQLVCSIADGVVYKTGYDGDGWGNYVVVKQNDGYFAIYAHLDKITAVKNEEVILGRFLGIMGATGNVTGAHLHLEIRRNYSNKYSTIDPAEYLGIQNKLGVVEMAENKNKPSSWSQDAWDWAEAIGLLDGTRPQEPVTREELAVILQRLLAIS